MHTAIADWIFLQKTKNIFNRNKYKYLIFQLRKQFLFALPEHKTIKSENILMAELNILLS